MIYLIINATAPIFIHIVMLLFLQRKVFLRELL